MFVNGGPVVSLYFFISCFLFEDLPFPFLFPRIMFCIFLASFTMVSLKQLTDLILLQGLVKLADFGVATKLTDTNSNESAGTTYWMAPEVLFL